MASEPTSSTTPPYVNCEAAPVIYFDFVPAHGVIGGAIQIELAGRTLMPMPDGSVSIEVLCTGRLRCSPIAAGFLRDALEAALKMLEQPQEQPAVASGKLN